MIFVKIISGSMIASSDNPNNKLHIICQVNGTHPNVRGPHYIIRLANRCNWFFKSFVNGTDRNDKMKLSSQTKIIESVKWMKKINSPEKQPFRQLREPIPHKDDPNLLALQPTHNHIFISSTEQGQKIKLIVRQLKKKSTVNLGIEPDNRRPETFVPEFQVSFSPSSDLSLSVAEYLPNHNQRSSTSFTVPKTSRRKPKKKEGKEEKESTFYSKI